MKLTDKVIRDAKEAYLPRDSGQEDFLQLWQKCQPVVLRRMYVDTLEVARRSTKTWMRRAGK